MKHLQNYIRKFKIFVNNLKIILNNCKSGHKAAVRLYYTFVQSIQATVNKILQV